MALAVCVWLGNKPTVTVTFISTISLLSLFSPSSRAAVEDPPRQEHSTKNRPDTSLCGSIVPEGPNFWQYDCDCYNSVKSGFNNLQTSHLFSRLCKIYSGRWQSFLLPKEAKLTNKDPALQFSSKEKEDNLSLTLYRQSLWVSPVCVFTKLPGAALLWAEGVTDVPSVIWMHPGRLSV